MENDPCFCYEEMRCKPDMNQTEGALPRADRWLQIKDRQDADLHTEGLDGLFGDAGAPRFIQLLQDIELRAAA